MATRRQRTKQIQLSARQQKVKVRRQQKVVSNKVVKRTSSTVPRFRTSQRNPLLPFGNEMTMDLTYVSTINFSIAAALDTYFWRGNGAYDPDYSSTGHQPFGYDQWTAFFDRYTVISSSVELKVISGGTPTPCTLALVPTRATTDFTTVGEAIESPWARFGILDDNNPVPIHLKHRMASHVILETTRKKILDDDVYSGGTTSDPTHPWYWAVCAGTYSGNLDLFLAMKITYRIRFYEPVQLSQS